MTLYEKDILKELYYSDTYYFKIDKAYIKNGMVYIHGLFLNTLSSKRRYWKSDSKMDYTQW